MKQTLAARPVTIIESVRLSNRLQTDVILASETFQHTGSFKFRAAHNVAARVPQQHIIAASSGNFGQALAFACKLLSKDCTIVMPATSAGLKIDAVRDFGATVDLVDVTVKSRKARVEELSRQYPQACVASAYDDPLVIEGNATLGAELALSSKFDCIVAPLGGGGLTAGIIQGLRAVGNATPVLAVEPEIANDGARSFRAGRIIANDSEPQTIADGVRTLSLGQHNWAILKKELSGVIEVSEQSIAEAMRLLFLLANLKAEPTGALSVAGVMSRPELFSGKRVCCVVSGGNVDPETFARVLLNVPHRK